MNPGVLLPDGPDGGGAPGAGGVGASRIAERHELSGGPERKSQGG